MGDSKTCQYFVVNHGDQVHVVQSVASFGSDGSPEAQQVAGQLREMLGGQQMAAVDASQFPKSDMLFV